MNQLHTDLNSGLTDPVIEEQLWEVQRVVTQLKRKVRTIGRILQSKYNDNLDANDDDNGGDDNKLKKNSYYSNYDNNNM